MKYVIAEVNFWEQSGFSTTYWRKSADGTQAIAHYEHVVLMIPRIDKVANATVYDSVQTSFQDLMKSPAWSSTTPHTLPNSYSILADIEDFKSETTAQLAETATQLSTKRALKTYYRILNKQTVKIVCKGDSITNSVKPDATQVTSPYPKILQDKLSYIYDNPNLTVLNKGVPGHNSTQGLATFQTDVIANNPNLVIIMYGANDSYQSMSLTTFKNNLTQMVRLSKEDGIEVIICSPTPMMRVVAANPKQNIAAYSEVCKEVADSESVDFLDMYEEFSNLFLTNAINASVFTDELHLTDFGYQLLADIVIKEKFAYSFKPKLSIGEYVGMHSPYVVTNLTTKYSSTAQKLFYNLLLDKPIPNKYIKFLVYIDKPNLTMTILNVQASLSWSAIVYDFGIEYATLTLTKPAVLTYDIETDMPMTVGLHCFYVNSNTVTTQFNPSGYFLKKA